MLRPQPISILFPYTTLFRSLAQRHAARDERRRGLDGRRHHPRRARLQPAQRARRSDDLEALRSEEHTSELQSRRDLVCRLLLEKKNKDESAMTPEENTLRSSVRGSMNIRAPSVDTSTSPFTCCGLNRYLYSFPTRRSSDLSLNVTPHVTSDGAVSMDVAITRDEPDFNQRSARGEPTILKR